MLHCSVGSAGELHRSSETPVTAPLQCRQARSIAATQHRRSRCPTVTTRHRSKLSSLLPKSLPAAAVVAAMVLLQKHRGCRRHGGTLEPCSQGGRSRPPPSLATVLLWWLVSHFSFFSRSPWQGCSSDVLASFLCFQTLKGGWAEDASRQRPAAAPADFVAATVVLFMGTLL